MLLIEVANGKIADANEAAVKFYKYSYKKLCSLNIADINILTKAEIQEQIDGLNNNKIVQPFYKHKIADNTIRDIQVFSTAVQKDGKKYNLAIVQDITQLKMKEEESNRFKNITDKATSFISIANMQGEVYYINELMRTSFAIPENADLAKYTEFDFYSSKGRDLLKNVFSEIVQHGFWKGENEMQSLDGKIYLVLQTIVLMKDANGQPQFTSSTSIDISERKRLELSLKNSDQKLKQAELIGKFGYFEFDLTNQIFHFSEGARKIYGLNSSEVPAAVIQGMRLPEYKNVMNETIKNLIENDHVLDIEYKVKKQVNNEIVGIHEVSRYDDKKHIIFGSIQNITDRMNVAEALKQSEEKFKHLITEINIGVIVYGANAEINMFNTKAIELFDISEEQILSEEVYKKDWDVIHEDGSNFPAETYPGIEAFVHKKSIKDVVMGVYHQIKKERVWILATAIPEFDQNDEISQVIVTFYDITEKRKKDKKIKKLNDELIELTTRIQKLREEERNKLAGEVHDKLGQKLVGIKFQIDFLRSQLNRDSSELTKKADSIAKEIALMVKDFGVIYAEVNPSFIDDLALYDTIGSLVYSYRKYDKIKFDFSFNIQNESLSHQIKWVLYKTVNGCLDNIVLHSQANMASVKLFKENGILSLIVQDDGCGFDASKIDFKTQIGLIEMRESVQSIGGVIDFESAPGKGTKVKVSIPEILS